MQDAAAIQGIEVRYAAMVSLMDERMRRQWAAAEASSYGWGGVCAVSHATGMSRSTIRRGLAELEVREADPEAPMGIRLRKAGAGRRRATEVEPDLVAALERLVDPVTRGDPMSPLRWTCKSTTQLARELTRQRHPRSRGQQPGHRGPGRRDYSHLPTGGGTRFAGVPGGRRRLASVGSGHARTARPRTVG